MAETARTLDELSNVHEAIRHYVAEANKSIDDLGQVSSQCAGEFDAEQCRLIADRQFDLRQTLQYLREGLQDHQRRENAMLGPLVGDVLMRAIEKECAEISARFEKANNAVEDTERSGLSPEDLLEKSKQARQAIEAFSGLVENHSRKMDTILRMIRDGMAG